jgi:hypothetical protein
MKPFHILKNDAGGSAIAGCQILFLDGKDFACLHFDVPDEADTPGYVLEFRRGNCWTFEGPDKYSLVGRVAWLSSKRVVELIGGQVFADHCNATTAIGLDNRGIAEVDLDAERRLDVWKVRSVLPKPGQVRLPQLRKLEP